MNVPGSEAEVVRPAAAGSVSAAQEGQASASASVAGEVSKSVFLFDTIISVSLVALFFGLPIFFTSLTLQGVMFEKQLYFYFWVLIGSVAWVSRSVIVGEMRVRRTQLDIPIVLFWVFYCIAAFFSVDRWHSFWGFFGDPSRGVVAVTALVWAYYFLLSQFTPRRFHLMFWSFLLSGFIVTAWSFLAMMQILPAAWEKFAPFSLLGTVSALGIFLSVLLPLFMTALFVIWKNDALRKIYRTLLTGIIFIGLALSLFLLLALYPFVSWIMVFAGLSFFLVYILAQIVRPAGRWTWAPMIVFTLVLAFWMIGKNTLVRATLPVEVAPNMNLSWQIAKETVKEHFWVGVGPANYGYAFSMFRPLEYNLNTLYTLRFYQGTGLFMEMLSTIGAIGTALFFILWLAFISIGLYLLSHDKQRNKAYSLGLWTAVMMFFLANFISVITGSLLIIGALLASLALGVLLWESGIEDRYFQLSFKDAPKFALALAFIVLVISAGVAFTFVFLGKVFIADVHAGKAVVLAATGPNRDSVDLLSRAMALYPQEGRYQTRLGQEYMALANIEANKSEEDRDTETIAVFVRDAVEVGERAKRLMPNDVLAIESLGLIYENAGLYARDALPKAEELYGRALELEPHNPLYFLKIGQMKKLSGDAKPEGAERDRLYAEAQELFQQAIGKKQDLSSAYYNRAIIYSYQKDIDRAIENAQEALRYERNNLNYAYNLGVLYQSRNKEGDSAVAERIFTEILTNNSQLADVRLNLGLLYEAQGKQEAAITEYEKLLELLPDDDTENVQQTRDQIQAFIENVRSGAGNLSRQNPVVAPVETVPASQTPALLPQIPTALDETPLPDEGQ